MKVLAIITFIYYFLTNDKDITLTSISIIYLIFIFYIGYKFFRYFLNFNSDNLKLILYNNKLILEHENGKKEEIYFINIRSFLKEKFIFSYQFFIYEDDELEPKIKFSTTSIHTAIAIEELLKFKELAPALNYAHPTVEHFAPIFVTLGASSDAQNAPQTTIDGYWYGLSKRSFQVD